MACSEQHSPLDSEVKSSPGIIRNISNSNGITGPNTKVLSYSGKDSEVLNPIASSSSSGPANVRRRHCSLVRKGRFSDFTDITKGAEKVKISLADDPSNEQLPAFNYIPHNIIYQSAHVQFSLARIADEDCCSSCMGDCLSSRLPCACARETGGEFAYTPVGQLKEEFLESCKSTKVNPQEKDFVYCQDCPIERSRNESRPEKCKGHLIRKFIKECWRKCGCDMHCGNRIVQRGITCKLQVSIFFKLFGASIFLVANCSELIARAFIIDLWPSCSNFCALYYYLCKVIYILLHCWLGLLY